MPFLPALQVKGTIERGGKALKVPALEGDWSSVLYSVDADGKKALLFQVPDVPATTNRRGPSSFSSFSNKVSFFLCVYYPYTNCVHQALTVPVDTDLILRCFLLLSDESFALPSLSDGLHTKEALFHITCSIMLASPYIHMQLSLSIYPYMNCPAPLEELAKAAAHGHALNPEPLTGSTWARGRCG